MSKQKKKIIIPKPEITAVEWDMEQNASILYDKTRPLPIVSQVRGGLCFPTPIQLKGEEIGGFLLIAGREANGTVTVYEQLEYLTIENILNYDLAIEYKGISNFVNDGWSKYFCRLYYWKQPLPMVQKYRLDIQRSVMIEPKPTLVSVDWRTDEDGYLAIWQLLKTRRLLINRDTPLQRAIDTYKTVKKAEPAIHALQCLLFGYNKIPYLTN